MAEAAFRGIPVKALLVPKDSVVRTSRGAFVYVVNPAEEGKPLSVRQVLVSLGIGTGVWIQVQGESLAAGQQVVTEGADRDDLFAKVCAKIDVFALYQSRTERLIPVVELVRAEAGA